MSSSSERADKLCPSCGNPVPYFNDHCYSCGYDYPLQPDSDSKGDPTLDTEGRGEAVAVLVWNYPGRTQADAAATFAKHAQELSADGYVPVAQSWADGRPGAGRVFALGMYAASLRPKGYLTVTYRLIAPVTGSRPSEPDVLDQIRRLGELRDAGYLTADEFEAKKAELLARV